MVFSLLLLFVSLILILLFLACTAPWYVVPARCTDIPLIELVVLTFFFFKMVVGYSDGFGMICRVVECLYGFPDSNIGCCECNSSVLAAFEPGQQAVDVADEDSQRPGTRLSREKLLVARAAVVPGKYWASMMVPTVVVVVVVVVVVAVVVEDWAAPSLLAVAGLW